MEHIKEQLVVNIVMMFELRGKKSETSERVNVYQDKTFTLH